MTEFDKRCDPGSRTIYRLEVYRLDYDTEHNAFYDDIAFCTGYATWMKASEAVDCIEAICAHTEPGWNPFTSAVIVKVNLDKGTNGNPVGTRVLCRNNVERLGHDLHYGEEDEK